MNTTALTFCRVSVKLDVSIFFAEKIILRMVSQHVYVLSEEPGMKSGRCIFMSFYQNIRRIRHGRVVLFAVPMYIILCTVLLCGCSFFISSATVDMTESLSHAILNNNDPATVEAGGPAYLLMIDGMVYRDPDNESLLRSAAGIYTAYTDVFVEDKTRAKKLTHKALDYALRAICVRSSATCTLRRIKFQEFETVISKLGTKDVPDLFTLGSAWAAWIQAHREDWNAVAEISRVQVIMERVVELDEYYNDGAAHLYLGVLATFLPPALGGKPHVGRQHFERALDISKNKNLMAKVLYAGHYARMMFDRELHDRLLNEVLRAQPDIPGYALSNAMAQQKAREFLDSAEDYF
jgi:hypothetical protein